MKSVLISIQPKWCELIASGKKTVEVRKTRPKLETMFKVYIYCTKEKPTFTQSAFCDDISNGKVIGEFVCDRIIDSFLNNNDGWFVELGCLTPKEIDEYQGDKAILFGWHISNLKVYDKPRELSEFSKYGFGHPVPLKRPPQSWMYVEGPDE
ncbi:MAG: ASCH domain-containing protein [Clostridia bacterium]|nr:ASCH domain-containing protein [Clostridia bacterium]